MRQSSRSISSHHVVLLLIKAWDCVNADVNFQKKMKNIPINFGQRYYPMQIVIVLILSIENLDRGNPAEDTSIRDISNKLCDNALFFRGSLVVADNYYNTTVLLLHLKFMHGLYYLGTLRSNRLTIDVPAITQYTYGNCIDGVLRLPYSYNKSDEFNFKSLQIILFW